jgi:nickel transport protein
MRRKMYSASRITILFILVSALLATASLAHKINVFAYAEAGEVKVESYFADGRPVKQSRVMVYDGGEKLLLEGKTDDEGLFSFAIPKVDDLEIVVREILGHRNTFTVKKSELEAAMTAAKDSN